MKVTKAILTLVSILSFVSSQNDLEVDHPDSIYQPNPENIDAFLAKHPFVLLLWNRANMHETYVARRTLLDFCEYLIFKRIENVVVADVDIERYPELAERFGIKGYLILKFYHHTREIHFDGKFDFAGLVRWVMKRVNREAVYLDKQDSEFKGEDQCYCLLWQRSFVTEEIATLSHLAHAHHDVVFYFTELPQYLYRPNPDSDWVLEVHRKADNATVTIAGNGTISEHQINKFVRHERHADFHHYNARASNRVFHHKRPSIFLFFKHFRDHRLAEFAKVGKKFKDRIEFYLAHQSTEQTKLLAKFLGVKSSHDGMITLLTFEEGLAVKYRLKKWSNSTDIENFVTGYLKGQLKPYMKSQKAPENNDGLFKKLVASEVDKYIVQNPNNVLVYVHGTTTEMENEKFVMNWLADYFEHAHEFNTTLMEYDSSLNDHFRLNITMHPQFMFFKSGDKDNPERFFGTPEPIELVQWLERIFGKKIRYPGTEKELNLDESL